MVNLRKRVRSDEISANPTPPEEKYPYKKTRVSSSNKNKEAVSKSYEDAREDRIKENLLRMQKLGILDLTRKLKSQFESRKTPQKKAPKPKCPSSDPLLRRRSSRLQNVTPVNYVDVHPKQGDNSTCETKVLLEEGTLPEIYTEEHEKLLGTCKMPWVLFKDGYAADGRRVYDPVYGKTCHQCRQKTLGHRTCCSKCDLVQGQFCGDCLYMRYGENVLEANQNPEWVCPVCRGICNCSICRFKKGWAPTGSLYKKVSSLGFQSVAHYLIQTRCSVPHTENPVPVYPFSSKRSLHFVDAEDLVTDSHNRHELDPTINRIKIGSKHTPHWKNKQQKAANQAGVNIGMTNKSNVRMKCAVSKPDVAKRLRQDDKDANVVKPAEVLLVGKDGIAHFAHGSNQNPATVARLSLDGVLHYSWESEPELPTASPEACLSSVCMGAGGAQASDVASQSEVKPSIIPQQSPENVIHVASLYSPEAVTPATASANVVQNGELGAKDTGVAAEGESNRDAKNQLFSDVIPSVASPSKPKVTEPSDPSSVGVGNGALGAEVSGVEVRSNGKISVALHDICSGALGASDTVVVALGSESNREVENQLCPDGVPSVISPSKLKPIATSDLSSVDMGNGSLGAEALVISELSSDDAIPVALQSKPNKLNHTSATELSSVDAGSGALCVAVEPSSDDAIPAALQNKPDSLKPTIVPDLSSFDVGNGALRAEVSGVAVEPSSDGAVPVEAQGKPDKLIPISAPDLSSADVGNWAFCAEALGVALEPSSDVAIPVALQSKPNKLNPTIIPELSSVDMGTTALEEAAVLGAAAESSSDVAFQSKPNITCGMTDADVASECGLVPATSLKASSSSGVSVHVPLQSELQAPETPELCSDSISIGKFGSEGIAATTGRKKKKKASKSLFVSSPSWNSIAGRLKRRRGRSCS